MHLGWQGTAGCPRRLPLSGRVREPVCDANAPAMTSVIRFPIRLLLFLSSVAFIRAAEVPAGRCGADSLPSLRAELGESLRERNGLGAAEQLLKVMASPDYTGDLSRHHHHQYGKALQENQGKKGYETLYKQHEGGGYPGQQQP